jgi:tRNA(Ile)-lysidine synthase
MLVSREDADPCVGWADSEMHRYRDRLYLINATLHDAAKVYTWDGSRPLLLDTLGQTLELVESDTGLRSDVMSRQLNVRFRQGGEKIRPAGRDGHHSLKKLYQERAIPPWLRDRIPLLFLEDELIAVVGYWIADDYASSAGTPAFQPLLKPL